MSSKYSFQFVSPDPYLAASVKKELEHFPLFSGTFTNEFSVDVPFPVTVLPARSVLELKQLSEDFFSSMSCIAYGSTGSLRNAFLAGCQDYMKEPWTVDEMVFRIQRIGRPNSFELHSQTIEFDETAVFVGQRSETLSNQEYQILHTLVHNQGTTVPRTVLIMRIRKRANKETRVVDVHISSLRKKLQTVLNLDIPGSDLIMSVHGIGYRLPFC